MDADSSLNSQYMCIHCGHKAEKLYQQYKGGSIKIAHCVKCQQVVDKYVEYDLVIISLDALLLKKQAFRHILMNSGIKSHWKFCMVLLLCDAFTKLMRQRSVDREPASMPDHMIYSALEVDLYWNFFIAVVELSCFILGVLAWVALWKYFIDKATKWPSLRECANGLVWSSFGQILVIPAVLWGQKYILAYLWLSQLFTIAANIQATRVLCPGWNQFMPLAAILFGRSIAYSVKYWIPASFAVG